MVRLKVRVQYVGKEGERDFNSKMVRLKVSNEAETKRQEQFQFQNGTIKRIAFSDSFSFCKAISIPKWYD